MKVFNAYAKYYDLLYKNKDYIKEADYISRFIKKYKPDTKTILDLGCGTGRHDLHLSVKGFDITGVELSEDMYSAAVNLSKENGIKNNSLKFYKGDIRKIVLLKKFDAVISLFHVINYQTSNEDLEMVFQTVKKHLKKGGLFMFDFWYGPAVLSDRPEKKTLIMEDEGTEIKRFTIPELKVNENMAIINFNVEVKNRKSLKIRKLKEIHKMRYLFLPELESIYKKFSLENIYTAEWLTGKNLSDKTWYGFTVLRNES